MDLKKLACHALMLIGLVYLLITRYLIYVHSPELFEYDRVRAAAANASYFTVYVLAYWISFTSRPIITNSIIGLLSILASPAIMPVVGYFGLTVMATIRFFSNRKSELNQA